MSTSTSARGEASCCSARSYRSVGAHPCHPHAPELGPPVASRAAVRAASSCCDDRRGRCALPADLTRLPMRRGTVSSREDSRAQALNHVYQCQMPTSSACASRRGTADRNNGTADRNNGTADRNDGTADRNDGTADRNDGRSGGDGCSRTCMDSRAAAPAIPYQCSSRLWYTCHTVGMAGTCQNAPVA